RVARAADRGSRAGGGGGGAASGRRAATAPDHRIETDHLVVGSKKQQPAARPRFARERPSRQGADRALRERAMATMLRAKRWQPSTFRLKGSSSAVRSARTRGGR